MAWTTVRTTALTTNTSGWNGNTIRQRFPDAGLSNVVGNQIRITFKSASATGSTITEAWVALEGGSGNYTFSSASQLKFGGSASVSWAANTTQITDSTTLIGFDGIVTLVISWYVGGTPDNFSMVTPPTNSSTVYKAGNESGLTGAISGYNAGSNYDMVALIEVNNVTVFTDTIADTSGTHFVLASTPAVIMADSVLITPAQIPALKYGYAMSENLRVNDSDMIRTDRRFHLSNADGIGVNFALTPKWYIGRVIRETVNVQQTLTPTLRFGWTLAEQAHMHEALLTSVPVVLTTGIGVHAAVTTSLAVTILQALGIAASPLPTLKYTQTLVQGIGMSDAFRSFFGAALSDGIGVTQTLSKQFRASPTISDGIGIHEALSNHFYIRVTISDRLVVDDDNVLKMIYNGQLADGIEIVASYVSPDGQFTTWAINTRTSAVSEYSNYAFNSFAQIGNLYFGASATGLYQLTGDDDDGADIIADIKSGYAEWGGSKFTMFKAAYLGVHGAGDYVLKLITGDGNTYTYSISGNDMRSTKVHIGKGIRTRYFAFELISTGQDFDLDTIEFVPLVVERRV